MSDIDLHYTDIFRRSVRDISSAQDKTDIAVQTTKPTSLVNETFQTGIDMGSDFNSSIWDVSESESGSLQAIWTGVTFSGSVNFTMILEGSTDQINWSDLGGNLGGALVQSDSDDDQIWEFTEFTIPYVRLAYSANNVTGGTMIIKVSER